MRSSIVKEGAKYSVMDSFEAIYDRYRYLVFHIALKRTQTPQDAEDLTQEVFIKIFKQCKKGLPAYTRTEQGMIKWVNTVAVNACIDHYRHAQLEVDTISMEELTLPDGTPADLPGTMPAPIQEIDLTKFSLDSIDIQLIEETYYEGYTSRECAALRGVSIHYVKTRLYRARQQMHKGLVQQGISA